MTCEVFLNDSINKQVPIRTVAFLGTHLPRQCGIATFTSDLAQALADEAPTLDCLVVAMNDKPRTDYPQRVRFEIGQEDHAAYQRAAEFLNERRIDIVSLQHEYGIFGGPSGAHVIDFMRALRMPIVTTLHTVLPRPSLEQRKVLEAVMSLSARVVVMSADGAALLQKVHGVPPSKIDLIPHGAPAKRAVMTAASGAPVILTFGLLSPDKGLEYVIDAMPEVLKKHPTASYVIVGATHPHVKAEHGEAYRESLQARAKQLGVSKHVIFHNRFMSHDEVLAFLSAATVYVTPYLKEEQSTSGTLAWAVACGKAVISTPYRYARELLADGRGVLVPWRDAGALAREINSLLDEPARRGELERHAAELSADMRWPTVARKYLTSFALASEPPVDAAPQKLPLPELNLSHLLELTDETGLLQHANYAVPRFADGYCVDDNARALLLASRLSMPSLCGRYLAFLKFAFEPESGRFRNFLDYGRVWREREGSEDSHGRALWALGNVVGHAPDPSHRALSDELFLAALPATARFTSPRAWAYTLLGIDAYLCAFAGDSSVVALQRELAARLVERYRHSSYRDWPWFENSLTYCNARLPQALLVTAARQGNPEHSALALGALQWLVTQQESPDGLFAPVGTDGFFIRGEPKAPYDQQPVEACATVSACLDAHRITGDASWLEHATVAFEWFLGRNARQVQLYDAHTGGCRDGVHVDRLNQNQGAESTLSFLMALTELRAREAQ